MIRLLARTALVLACAGAAPVALRAQAAQPAAAAQPAGKTPDFSGTWELNLAKSQFGAGGAPTRGTMVITQAGNKITRLQSLSSPMGEMKNTMHHTIGAATIDTVQMAGQSATFASTARLEGSTMVVDGKISIQGVDVPVVGRYTVSPDGKQLLVDQTITVPMAGEQATHLVYDKKG